MRLPSPVNESEAAARTAQKDPTTRDHTRRLPLNTEAARRRESTGGVASVLLRKRANKQADFRDALSSLERSPLAADGCLFRLSPQTPTTQGVIRDPRRRLRSRVRADPLQVAFVSAQNKLSSTPGVRFEPETSPRGR